MIVIDASVVLELLLRTRASPAIEARLLDSGETLHAPQLLDVEVAQVLRRYAGRNDLGGAGAPRTRYSGDERLPTGPRGENRRCLEL